jgi:hypothetical protein
VVGVRPVVAVQVKGEAAVLGKGTKELGEELYVEGAYLLGHGSQVAGEMTTSPKVHNGGREGLYKGSGGVGEADEVRAVAQSFVESAPQDESRIFYGVVKIYVKVSLGLDGKVHARMVGEKMHKVVEETDAGPHLGASFAVEGEAHLHVRLAGLSFGFADSLHRFSFGL